jgi:hypothetical protein
MQKYRLCYEYQLIKYLQRVPAKLFANFTKIGISYTELTMTEISYIKRLYIRELNRLLFHVTLLPVCEETDALHLLISK